MKHPAKQPQKARKTKRKIPAVWRRHPVKAASLVLLGLLLARTVALAFVTPQPPAPATSVMAAQPYELGHGPTEPDKTPLRRIGPCWARHTGGMLQAYFQGLPEQIGQCHVELLRSEMVEGEEVMWQLFERIVPTFALRVLIMDISRVQYAGLSESFGYARRAEVGAMSRTFQPDPFDDYMPTFARFLMLNALYDVALSYEHSPLVGCSSVFFSREGLLGRNFDFEIHDIFDTGKAVMIFAEDGKVPVLSVAWPGLAGVVTGMNANGVAAVVHGARASHPVTTGEPVMQTIREALAQSRSASDAANWIAKRNPMVSHIVLVADATGHSVIMERAPGHLAHFRHSRDNVVLSNHMEGPLARDPANLRVIEKTSTIARRKRLDVLVDNAAAQATPKDIVAILRDKRAPDGTLLASGDRRAIDADIATHGVVMDLKRRVIWVSQGPHLQRGFAMFDLARLMADPQRAANEPSSAVQFEGN